MKPILANLACSWGLPRPVIKSHHKKSGCDPGLRGCPNFGVPCNISATAGATDFKFCSPLRFAMTHHKITQRKKWAWPWAREFPEISRFPFNTYTLAEASDFKFGTQLGFAKAHHKITPIGTNGCGLGLGELPKKFSGSPIVFLQRLNLATSKLARSWSLPKPIIKSQTEKVDVDLG